MNTTVHVESKRGFTLSEVMLAVGIVAFGLVAVFSILPFGLTAQKDNREETIVRYEAEYWFAVLQAGGMPLESMDRVETVELTDANGTVYSINRHDLRPLDPSDPLYGVPGEYEKSKADARDAKAGWPVDVCGWLSAPDYIWNKGSKINRVPAKFARVWAINGSLFDRLYSPRGPSGHYLDGGEFSFGYFLETKVEPEKDSSASRLTLTFHWPITEPVENALRPKSPTNPGGGKRIESIVNNPQTRLANRKSFSINTNLRSRPALSYVNLDARQSQFMRAGLPGDEVSIKDLQAIFQDRKSWDPLDGFKRKVKVTGPSRVGIVAANLVDNQFQEFIAWNPAAGNLRMMLSYPDDLGWYLQVLGPDIRMREFYASMKSIHPGGNNDFALLEGAIPPKYLNNPNRLFDFKISFLHPDETWEDVLSDYQRFGLVEKRHDKYRINSIYNSYALGALTNSAGQIFRIPLKDADYWPAKAPLNDRNCSFWFLK